MAAVEKTESWLVKSRRRRGGVLNVYNRKPQDEIIASQRNSDKVKLVESKSCYEAAKCGKPAGKRESKNRDLEACEATAYTK